MYYLSLSSLLQVRSVMGQSQVTSLIIAEASIDQPTGSWLPDMWASPTKTSRVTNLMDDPIYMSNKYDLLYATEDVYTLSTFSPTTYRGCPKRRELLTGVLSVHYEQVILTSSHHCFGIQTNAWNPWTLHALQITLKRTEMAQPWN